MVNGFHALVNTISSQLCAMSDGITWGRLGRILHAWFGNTSVGRAISELVYR